MSSVTVFVHGRPVTQGSMSVGKTNEGKPFAYHQKSARLRDWRDAINLSFRSAYRGAPRKEAVGVYLEFYLPRPKSQEGEVYPIVSRGPAAGDIDKLTRAVLDGLTGPAFVDDSQVVRLVALKRWGEPGARITVFWGSDLESDGR